MVFVAAGVAAVGVAGSVASSKMASDAQSKAAGKATKAQQESSQSQLQWDKQQWAMEQASREPWVQAGRNALGTMEGLAGQAQPAWQAQQRVDPWNYTWEQTPTVTPTGYQGPATIDPNQYRFDPSGYGFQGPQAVSAADYRYTPGETLDPNQYRYTPTETGTLGRFDFTPPTLTDDPGYQFRLRQGQEALDASAAARGGLSSGAQLKALQSFGQELGSQEYGAAYGRSWQQHQEAYERARLANMTEEERQRYGNQTTYARAQEANMTEEQRRFAANQFNYGTATQQQQLAWAQQQKENEMRYGRDLAANEQWYGRDVQRQGLDYAQGLATDDLNYRRLVEENALRESRGLTANQLTYGRDVAANETAQARAWQAYAAEIANRDRTWNQYATLAGYGQKAQTELGQLGLGYSQAINSAYAQQGNAASAGAIAQGNAQAGMWGGIGSGVSDVAKSFMTWYGTQPQTPAAPTTTQGLTSGTLPTTWGQYNQGGFANTTYAPFG